MAVGKQALSKMVIELDIYRRCIVANMKRSRQEAYMHAMNIYTG